MYRGPRSTGVRQSRPAARPVSKSIANRQSVAVLTATDQHSPPPPTSQERWSANGVLDNEPRLTSNLSAKTRRCNPGLFNHGQDGVASFSQERAAGNSREDDPLYRLDVVARDADQTSEGTSDAAYKTMCLPNYEDANSGPRRPPMIPMTPCIQPPGDHYTPRSAPLMPHIANHTVYDSHIYHTHTNKTHTYTYIHINI